MIVSPSSTRAGWPVAVAAPVCHGAGARLPCAARHPPSTARRRRRQTLPRSSSTSGAATGGSPTARRCRRRRPLVVVNLLGRCSSGSRPCSTCSTGWPAVVRRRGRCGSAGACPRSTMSVASTPDVRLPEPDGCARTPALSSLPAAASRVGHAGDARAHTRACRCCSLVVTVCASPTVRARAHNVFELSHRWGGWTAIALFWVLTVHLALNGRGETSAAEAIASRMARLGAHDPDDERRLAVVAAATRVRSLSSAHRRTLPSSTSTTTCDPPRRRRSASAAARCESGMPSPPCRGTRGAWATGCSSPVPATGPVASSMIRRHTSGCAACRSRHRWRRCRCCTTGWSSSSPAVASGRASARSSPTASRPGWCGRPATLAARTATLSSTRWR